MSSRSTYLRHGIDAAIGGVETLAESKALDIGELDLVRAEGFCATRAQQSCVQKIEDAHSAVEVAESSQVLLGISLAIRAHAVAKDVRTRC